MQKDKYKVYAYITHQQRLLVFSHVGIPEAGIQVPAGTVEEHERPADAVLREAFEETGLTDLTLSSFLSEQVQDISHPGSNKVLHHCSYHLDYHGNPPACWRHAELSPHGSPAQEVFIFELFWVSVADDLSWLIANHGIMLPRLREELSRRQV